MTRLIDADALYEQIAKKEELARQRVLDTPSWMPNGAFNPPSTRYATQLDERIQMEIMISNAPTIDAVPVRHGKWVPKYIRICGQDWASGMKCSECGEDALDAEGDEFLTDYCPNCGARMDEE